MEQYISEAILIIREVMLNNGYFIALILGTLLVICESIIPVLPLAVFIAINTIVLGNVVGFLISWIGTIIGCILSFYIFRLGFYKYIYKKPNKRIDNFIDRVSNIKLGSLVLIMAIPFTPAFSVNIAAGLSRIPFKKFLTALFISKAACVYFWGYVGSTFINSLTDISAMIKIAVMLIVSYVISIIVNKKFNID